MKQHFVIDSSVFLSYAAYNKLYRLENAVEKYGLKVYINATLLDELEKNLPKVLRSTNLTTPIAIDIIIAISTSVEIIPQFTLSPDPKDNFLFDLALQTNSEVIVTKEKALLNFIESPVPIHDIKWFKETYPVDL